jgi:hypothetical protein
MHSTLTPKHADDPHDILVVAPDAVRIAPADEELSKVLREAARHLSDQQTHAGSDLPASPSVPPVDPPVPSVDTTFRPAAVNDNRGARGLRPSIGSRAWRGFTAVLLTAGICAAGIVWQSSGEAAKKMLAKFGTQFFMTSSLTASPAQSAPPAVQADAANATPPQPAPPPAQTAAEAAAPPAADPSPESAQLKSMRNDLANLGQEVVLLKATIEQLRAGQQQMSRDVGKVSADRTPDRVSDNRASEPSFRPRKPAPPPPRLAAAPARRPMPPYPPPQATAAPLPQAAAAPYVPQGPAPYVPQQYEPAPPPATAHQTLADPELPSVPRPPMPLLR